MGASLVFLVSFLRDYISWFMTAMSCIFICKYLFLNYDFVLKQIPPVWNIGFISCSETLQKDGLFVRRMFTEMLTEFKAKFRDFSTSTSTHGLTYIASSSSAISKLFWSIICLSAAGLFLLMMILNMTQYFSYPTAINMAEIPNGFTLPLVSFCNDRHISSLVLQRLINIINYKDNVNASEYPCLTDLNGTNTTSEVQYLHLIVH